MKNRNSCNVPMENKLKPPLFDATKFRSFIGTLSYLGNIRPDIAYSVGIVSRHMETPRASHLEAVKKIMRYLAGTINYGCCYKKQEKFKPKLTGFNDSDLAGDVDGRKSASGRVFLLGSSLVTWV